MRFRLAIAALLVIGSGAGAGGAEAAVVAGSNLSQAGSTATCIPNPFNPGAPPVSCTLAIAVLAADRQEADDRAPLDGVIVGWRVRAGTSSEPISMRLRVVRGETGAGSGPIETMPAAAGIYTYPARLPVHAGDKIGLDLLEVATFPGAAIFATASAQELNIWFPPLADGQTLAPLLVEKSSYVLVNATIEPDADNDGFGDETQDKCLGSAGTGDGCPPPVPPPPPSSPPGATAPPSQEPPPVPVPDTGISKGPKNVVTVDRATFRFISTVAGSSFQCRLDKKPFRGCRSPKTYRNLVPGRHTFKVRAVGPSGLIDPVPAKRTFTVEP
jgi:hypothetical protein